MGTSVLDEHQQNKWVFRILKKVCHKSNIKVYHKSLSYLSLYRSGNVGVTGCEITLLNVISRELTLIPDRHS